MNFHEELAERTAWTENVVKTFLPEESGTQKEIMEAMNYSVMAGGKRLRPLLMHETYRMFGGTGRVILPLMAAIEMVHTYSLVHDDLPAMDNDQYRRGKLTTHAKYGHAMGVLAGDGLLNYAFETAMTAFDCGEDPERVAKALRILGRKAGIYGMIGGQVVDVQSTGRAVDQEKLDFIYELKTGALLEASMMVGAVLAGASDEEVEAVEKIASDVGLAFQIRDDILDVTGDEAVLGKPTKSDEKNHKITYVSVKGLDQARKDVERYSKEAVRLLEELPCENEFLHELILNLISRDA